MNIKGLEQGLEAEEREALKKAAEIIARRGEQASDYLEKAKARPSCENCGIQVPQSGRIRDGQRRWCVACAKRQSIKAGYVSSKSCVDCKLKRPTFGRVDDRQRRWCGACAKAHPNACDVNTKKCEDCKVAASGRVIQTPLGIFHSQFPMQNIRSGV